MQPLPPSPLVYQVPHHYDISIKGPKQVLAMRQFAVPHTTKVYGLTVFFP